MQYPIVSCVDMILVAETKTGQRGTRKDERHTIGAEVYRMYSPPGPGYQGQ